MMKKADRARTRPTPRDRRRQGDAVARRWPRTAPGLLVDGYYGYWSTVAAFAVPREHRAAHPRREVRGDEEQAGAPCGEVEPGWGVAQDQAVRGRRGQAARPVRAERARLGRAQLRVHPSRSTTSASKHDILFLLEPIHFPYNGEKDDSESIARRARRGR